MFRRMNEAEKYSGFCFRIRPIPQRQGYYMKKQLIILAGMLVLLLSICCICHAEIIDSGTCGQNLNWTLSDNGELRISGNGNMRSYGSADYNLRPWGAATTAVIDEGVTSIGSFLYNPNRS